jgi:SAM-dependent methyltransferase
MAYYADLFGPALYDVFFNYGQQSSHLLMAALREYLAPTAKVLDVGTGTGFVALEAASLIRDGYVTGIDLDEDALLLAKYKAKRQGIANVTFEKGDALQLEFTDNSFHVVVGSQVLGNVETQEQILREMARVICPGGVMGLVRPHPPGNHLFEWWNQVRHEVAVWQGKTPPEVFTYPQSDPVVLRGLLEQAGLENVTLERVSAGTANFPLLVLHSIAQNDLLSFVADAVQVSENDRESMIVGTLDYLEVGQQLLEQRYGGSLECECIIIVGRKAK